MSQAQQAVQGWAAHFTDQQLKAEVAKLMEAHEAEQRKLTRKARRTPRHVLQQRRPSVAIVMRG